MADGISSLERSKRIETGLNERGNMCVALLLIEILRPWTLYGETSRYRTHSSSAWNACAANAKQSGRVTLSVYIAPGTPMRGSFAQ